MTSTAAPSFSRVVRVARTGSTNADLAAALRDPVSAGQWPHLSVLVADHQAAGRGRSGRVWDTPAGVALTASVVLRPEVPLATWSWLGLLGGLAVSRAISRRTGLEVALKWPNDVLVVGAGQVEVPGWGLDRKVAGVLAETVAPERGSRCAILGIGVNVHQDAGGLPVPWATSIAAAGARDAAVDRAALLEALGEELAVLSATWQSAGGDAAASGLAAAVAQACVTLGRDVQVTLPDGAEVRGRAIGIAADGALEIRSGTGAAKRVTVGDVRHVRARNG